MLRFMLRFFDNLFDDIGGKIKGLVKWSFVVVAVLILAFSVIGMLFSLFNGQFLLLLLIPFTVVPALVVLWVGSWVMYAFGEMVQRVCNIDDRLTIARPAVSSGYVQFGGTDDERIRQKEADVVRKEAAQRAIREAEADGRPGADGTNEAAQRAIREAEGRSPAENAAMIQRSRDERISTAVAEFAGEEEAARQGGAEQKNKNELADKLAYALAFKTDEGMIRYLRSMDHELVNQILKEPRHLIRILLQETINKL